MISASNVVNLQGRLTRDAEEIMDGDMIKFTLATDYAGYEKGTDSNTGFFDCKVWLTDSDMNAASVVKGIRSMLESGRLCKGAMVRVIGGLQHERFEHNGQKRSNVSIVVESLESYARANDSDSSSSDASSNNQSSETNDPAPAVKAF